MKTQNVIKALFLLTLIFPVQNMFAQKASKVELPATYDFDYIYQLKMTHKKGDFTFDYYLKEDVEYFGFDSAEMSKSSPDTKMFMVMDIKRSITDMFMEMMGNKVVQKMKINTSAQEKDKGWSEYTFTEIDSKTINGYNCEGYVSENDKIKITFYITDEVPVSFNQGFGNSMKNLPKGFDASLMKKYADNGLMMEMIFEDKKKSKNNMTMQCTGLEKTDFSIDTSEYGSMMSAFGG